MSDPRRQHRNHEAGFTLLEYAMAMGLSALILLAVVSFYSGYTKKLNEMNENIENAADIESGEQIMLKDLKALDPSFGVIRLKDDTGQNFFDYFPDVHERDLPADPITKRPSRVYTMRYDPTNPGRAAFGEFILLVHDHNAHPLPSLIYDPTWAMQTSSCTAGCTVTGAMPRIKTTGGGVYASGVFDSATTRGAVKEFTSTGKLMLSYPGYWNTGQLLMLDIPVTFRGPTDPRTVAPRPDFFIGLVNAATTAVPTNFMPLAQADMFTKKAAGGNDQTNLLEDHHPVTGSTTGMNTAENFFLNVPPVGGGVPMIRMRPVRLVKYTIEPMYRTIDPKLPAAEQAKRRGALRIWRQLYVKGAWNPSKGRAIIAENVKTVQFRRTTVTDKAVTFTLSKSELKTGLEP